MKRASTVHLARPNPDWLVQAAGEIRRLKSALPANIPIEHFGSTALPNISAKPIIDLLAGLTNLAAEWPKLRLTLEQLGYTYVEKPDHPDRIFFRLGEAGNATVHLHLVELNGPEWTNKLLFRDYLRKHPDVAKHYEQEKLELAQQFANDRKAYTNAKTVAISRILTQAKQEQGSSHAV